MERMTRDGAQAYQARDAKAAAQAEESQAALACMPCTSRLAYELVLLSERDLSKLQKQLDKQQQPLSGATVEYWHSLAPAGVSAPAERIKHAIKRLRSTDIAAAQPDTFGKFKLTGNKATLAERCAPCSVRMTLSTAS
jgi:hypothetical protein